MNTSELNTMKHLLDLEKIAFQFKSDSEKFNLSSFFPAEYPIFLALTYWTIVEEKQIPQAHQLFEKELSHFSDWDIFQEHFKINLKNYKVEELATLFFEINPFQESTKPPTQRKTRKKSYFYRLRAALVVAGKHQDLHSIITQHLLRVYHLFSTENNEKKKYSNHPAIADIIQYFTALGHHTESKILDPACGLSLVPLTLAQQNKANIYVNDCEQNIFNTLKLYGYFYTLTFPARSFEMTNQYITDKLNLFPEHKFDLITTDTKIFDSNQREIDEFASVNLIDNIVKRLSPKGIAALNVSEMVLYKSLRYIRVSNRPTPTKSGSDVFMKARKKWLDSKQLLGVIDLPEQLQYRKVHVNESLLLLKEHHHPARYLFFAQLIDADSSNIYPEVSESFFQSLTEGRLNIIAPSLFQVTLNIGLQKFKYKIAVLSSSFDFGEYTLLDPKTVIQNLESAYLSSINSNTENEPNSVYLSSINEDTTSTELNDYQQSIRKSLGLD